MAALRPVVLVYQEFAQASVTAAVPDLNTLIVGPAYHIRDYPADSSSIEVANFHDKTAVSDANGNSTGLPIIGQDVIVLADPPDNAVGAILDSSSVQVWMSEALAQVANGNTGNADETTAPDENEFVDAGATFQTAGVQAGDRLVATTSDGTATVEKVVQSVTNETTLRVTSNFTAAGTDIDGNAYTGKTWNDAGVRWRIERELSDFQVSSSFYTVVGNVITLKGGVTTLVDLDGDNVDDTAVINYARVYVGYASLRQDLADVNTISNPAVIESNIGPIDERNPLAVGVSIALQNTTTPVLYYGVTGDDLNGASDSLTAYNTMLSLIQPRTDIYAIVPMSNDLSIVQAVQTHVEALDDPEVSNFRIGICSSAGLPLTAVQSQSAIDGTTETVAGDDTDVLVLASWNLQTNGVGAGDTIAILDTGNTRDGEYSIAEVYDEERLRVSTDIGTASTEAGNYYILDGAAGIVDEIVTAGDGSYLAASPSTITFATRTCSAADVGKVLRITNPSGPNTDQSPVSNDDYLITGFATGGPETLTIDGDPGTDQASLDIQIIQTLDSETAAGSSLTSRQTYRQLLSPSATFVTDGVIATDLLEVPIPAVSAGTDFTGSLFQGVVASVESENRVRLVAGSDIPTTTPTAVQTDVGYRVSRTLDKDDQVTNLIAVVESLESKRITMVWPDEVTLAGVQNDLTSTTSRQPGYYLAAAVGGMSAGLPPHQGFTNIGIAGIDQIYNSTRYFSETQLTSLSNAGWFVFLQETTATTPYVLHQLTTDVTTTENGELSIVRDFDYISLFYKDILDDFLGKYNVINQTLDLIREALNAGTTQLRSQVLPRIGAPVIDAQITSISVLDGTKDRVEVYMDVQLPFPLNRIGLHLVA